MWIATVCDGDEIRTCGQISSAEVNKKEFGKIKKSAKKRVDEIRES